MNSYFLRTFAIVSACTITATSTTTAGIAIAENTAIASIADSKSTITFAIPSTVFVNWSTAAIFAVTSSAIAVLMYIVVETNLIIKSVREMCLACSFAGSKLDARLKSSFSSPSFFYGYQSRACYDILL